MEVSAKQPLQSGVGKVKSGRSDLSNRLVLVLNKHWLAVHICTVRRAVSLLYQDLARVVTEDYQTFDFESWIERDTSNGASSRLFIGTPSFRLILPHVIVLQRYQRSPPRAVRFNRRNIYLRDRYQCQYCGQTPGRADLTIDHVIPRSRGGRSVWQNVAVACTVCNTKKGNRLPAECGMVPRVTPKRPSWMTTLRVIPTSAERSAWGRFIDSKCWQTSQAE
ncbi:HNH endonuclease [Candidatus Sumerlaeota bacterium]|nr:HNH endonuclease [Candidatus Sumerlaeota bacterium]